MIALHGAFLVRLDSGHYAAAPASRELERASVPVTHILSDGTLEAHRHAMERLASTLKLADTDLFRSPDELIEEAYEKQGSRISYSRSD